MDDSRTADLRASYDRIADHYVAHIYDELAGKPLDRALLDRFAAAVRGSVLELGCGPGQIARYLHDRGVDIAGVDLSPAMIARARQLNPAIAFEVGDMRALDRPDGALGGIVAFYSIIHIPRDEVVPTLREWRRVVRPGGLLLLAFHLGEEIVRLNEMWGEPVEIDFLFFQTTEMERHLTDAGFEIRETIERDPYPEVEHPSRRSYIVASRPDTSG